MSKSCLHVFAFLMALLAAASAGHAARPDLIELKIGGSVYRGKAVANDKSAFWLLQQDGRLRRLPIGAVSQYRSLAPRFEGFHAADLKAALRKELGRGFEVVSTSHYVVAGPPGRARRFADLFEKVYRTFVTYFGPRGFRLDKPAFPLVAVVFKDQNRFVKYATRDGIAIASKILGYYDVRSNRVALFDDPHAKLAPIGTGTPRFGGTTLQETIVHEGTHQVAFNTGVHSRIGGDPRWVVEGLATVFEAPGIRNRSGGRGAKSRINPAQLFSFRKHAVAGRKRGALKEFLTSDSRFTANLHAFYGEAWALTFFLLETRSQQYSKYHKLLAARNPLAPYTARERVADFQRAFGDDLARLERDYLRFIRGL